MKQERWRTVAKKMIPELEHVIENKLNAMRCFFELEHAFNSLSTPIETKMRIMGFAYWCWKQPEYKYRRRDLIDAVECAFIEHIVDRNKKVNWPIFKTYFSNADIRALQWLWVYNFGEDAVKFMRSLLRSKGKIPAGTPKCG